MKWCWRIVNRLWISWKQHMSANTTTSFLHFSDSWNTSHSSETQGTYVRFRWLGCAIFVGHMANYASVLHHPYPAAVHVDCTILPGDSTLRCRCFPYNKKFRLFFFHHEHVWYHQAPHFCYIIFDCSEWASVIRGSIWLDPISVVLFWQTLRSLWYIRLTGLPFY